MDKTKTTYAQRLKAARDHAGLSQSELGRQVDMSAQSIQYLEDSEKAAQGSNKTASIASVCGVSALWLETGQGTMTAGADAPLPSARGLATAIKTLPAGLQRAVGLVIGELADGSEVAGSRVYALSKGAAGSVEDVRLRTNRSKKPRTA